MRPSAPSRFHYDIPTFDPADIPKSVPKHFDQMLELIAAGGGSGGEDPDPADVRRLLRPGASGAAKIAAPII